MVTPQKSWLEVLDDAKAAINEAHHIFLSRYRKDAREVYGFVEGKTDPSFYRKLIQPMLPNSWDVCLIRAGNKNKVLECHQLVDWKTFDPMRICFFVDRDFSDLIGCVQPANDNIYVTDEYSIESCIATSDVFITLIKDVYTVYDLGPDEEMILANHFNAQLNQFCLQMLPLTAQMLLWRDSGSKAYLNELKMPILFKCNNGTVDATDAANLVAKASSHVKATPNTPAEIRAGEARLTATGNLRSVTRGKQLMWCFVELLKSVCEQLPVYVTRLTKSPKANTNLSPDNALVTVAPHARCPQTLSEFIDKNFITFIARRELIGTGPNT